MNPLRTLTGSGVASDTRIPGLDDARPYISPEVSVIFYLVFLYELPSQHATDFNHAFRDRRDRMGKIPGWIHTDLLEQSSPTRFLSRFLSISFFTSLEAVQVAERTPEMQTLLRWASGKATLCVNLGTFSFPPWPESGEDPHRLCAQTVRP